MSVDLFNKCRYFKKRQRIVPREKAETIANNILWGISPIDNGGPLISSSEGEWIQFSTNDYLGLSRNKEIRNFAAEFVKTYGIGTPMGARPLTGTTQLHLQLEREIAEFKKTEAALTFSVGLNAMTGGIISLVSKSDLIILDEFAHASLYFGARISGCNIKRFRHNDLDQLEDILKNANPRQGRLIVVDGVYSMRGDLALLPQICDLRDKYKARLFVDDAHGNGVLGKEGRGVTELLNVDERIDIHAGTFSKAFGSFGGFIASDKNVIDYIRFNAYTSLFTKAQPAVFAAVTMKALEIIRNGSHLRQKMWVNTDYLHHRLRELEFDIGNTVTPITPITFQGNTAIFIAHELRKNWGIWVSPVVFPAVPFGKSIIRVIPTAIHTKDQINYFSESLRIVYDQIKFSSSYI